LLDSAIALSINACLGARFNLSLAMILGSGDGSQTTLDRAPS